MSSYSIRDGGGSLREFKATQNVDDQFIPHHIVDSMPAVTLSGEVSLADETTKVIGTVNVAAGQSIGVTGTFWQATQPVSAAALPLPSGAATSANQTNGTQITQVSAFPTHHIDAFSRVRTSNPGYRFDAQLTYQLNNDVWDKREVTSGTVAHNSTLRAATLTAAASNGSQAILQSHYSPPYTPGRSHVGFLTFLFGATPSAGVSRRVGLYGEDGDIGIYLEQTSSAVNLVLKSGTGYTTQTVPQASWNIDPLTGNGPSGITLDLTSVQILVIQYQALYVGTATIAFDIDGEIVPVHQFKHANRIALPYIANASLPVHYSIRTTAAAGGTMTAICSSVISEGGADLENMPGRSFSANNGTTAVSITTARQSVLTIQCQSQLNSLNNRAIVIPQSVDVTVSGADALVEVLRNATVTGLSTTSLDANSTVFVDRAARAISASGTVIDSFYVNTGATGRTTSGASLNGKVVLCYSHLLAAGDTLTVAVTRNAANGTVSAFSALKWKEIR